jgi:hypothetical protein
MKGLHEVVHRDEQSQGVMGLRHRKLRSEERLGDFVPFLAKFVCFLQIVVFRQFWGFFRHFYLGNNISNCSIKHVITVR